MKGHLNACREDAGAAASLETLCVVFQGSADTTLPPGRSAGSNSASSCRIIEEEEEGNYCCLVTEVVGLSVSHKTC